jgi:hypothetical protein
MRRDRVESGLDDLVGERLSDRTFLEELATGYERQQNQERSMAESELLQAQLVKLQTKRARTCDLFVDGVIGRRDRDTRLAVIDGQVSAAQEGLLRLKPSGSVSVDRLVAVFSAFREWKYLERDDKRKLLSVVAPEISIADYTVSKLSLALPGVVTVENHMVMVFTRSQQIGAIGLLTLLLAVVLYRSC